MDTRHRSRDKEGTLRGEDGPPRCPPLPGALGHSSSPNTRMLWMVPEMFPHIPGHREGSLLPSRPGSSEGVLERCFLFPSSTRPGTVLPPHQWSSLPADGRTVLSCKNAP